MTCLRRQTRTGSRREHLKRVKKELGVRSRKDTARSGGGMDVGTAATTKNGCRPMKGTRQREGEPLEPLAYVKVLNLLILLYSSKGPKGPNIPTGPPGGTLWVPSMGRPPALLQGSTRFEARLARSAVAASPLLLAGHVCPSSRRSRKQRTRRRASSCMLATTAKCELHCQTLLLKCTKRSCSIFPLRLGGWHVTALRQVRRVFPGQHGSAR